MGILDRFRKEEKLHINPETRETSWVSTKSEPEKREIKELTREEQMEPQRRHPWQTPRGKRVIKSVGSGVKRVDKAIVNYNRRRPVRGMQSSRMPSYSTQNNYNPFGSMFDRGMYYSKPRKKTSGSKTKFAVVGGKAYPIAGTDKKKKRTTKKHNRNPFSSFDPIYNKWKW